MKKTKRDRGFTLIETLVVTGVLSCVALVALVVVGGLVWLAIDHFC